MFSGVMELNTVLWLAETKLICNAVIKKAHRSSALRALSFLIHRPLAVFTRPYQARPSSAKSRKFTIPSPIPLSLMSPPSMPTSVSSQW